MFADSAGLVAFFLRRAGNAVHGTRKRPTHEIGDREIVEHARDSCDDNEGLGKH